MTDIATVPTVRPSMSGRDTTGWSLMIVMQVLVLRT